MDNNSFVEDHLECPVLLVMTDDVLDVMKVKVAVVFVEYKNYYSKKNNNNIDYL
jgi:hypothetical protein